jgi:hypothetical protein
MAGPWIRVVSPGFGLSGLTWDALTDRLQRMGEVGRNGYPPSVIRATFQEAVRRNIMTYDEAAAGVEICLRVPLEKRTA